MADDSVTVRVTDNESQHRYEAYVDHTLAAFVTYERIPGGITFIHTETEPGYEGRGVASRLAEAALDDARSRSLRVTPLCPFIAAYIDRHPAYADLLDHSS
ncbi:MAG TPA: GNAT family N-acetyltransferase [Acidimicrobiales bacterium]|nr:GNAT family N-acetyltransferase [Acidimicrobiales bacterium]